MSDFEECASECECRVINSFTNSVSSSPSSGLDGDMVQCKIPTCGLERGADGKYGYSGHLNDPNYDPNDPANDPNSPDYDSTNHHNRRRFHRPWHTPWFFIPFFQMPWWKAIFALVLTTITATFKFIFWVWKDPYLMALAKSFFLYSIGVHIYDQADRTIKAGMLKKQICMETKKKSSVKIEDPIY